MLRSAAVSQSYEDIQQQPLRVAIKNSQRNSDIFAVHNTPASYAPRINNPRFDRNASTVFGTAWGTPEPAASVRNRSHRMASDIFNTSPYPPQQPASSASSHMSYEPDTEFSRQLDQQNYLQQQYYQQSREQDHQQQHLLEQQQQIGFDSQRYQPSFLQEGAGPRRVSPPTERGYKNVADHQYSHRGNGDDVEEADARVLSSPSNRFVGSASAAPPRSTRAEAAIDASSRPESPPAPAPLLPPSASSMHHHLPPRSTSFANIFSDEAPAAYHPTTLKRTSHHRHTNIFANDDTPDADGSSFSARRASAAAAAAATLPPQDYQHQQPRPSGRRHFHTPPRTSIFDFAADDDGSSGGYAASAAARAGPGIDVLGDTERVGGLSSAALNRVRAKGRAGRPAFEQSQIFF
ncbi:hypothetical protein HDU83_008406 [Entophlyctis luteolus]|nr:hypothetical protein HDU83_008406 [Entophlyctis luteolus]KAJ3389379.1 hypothetical protein HDU84_008828 [Entophlyctis sp. JEL0112]